jgi:hypothetical protein
LGSYLAEYFLEWGKFQTKFVQKMRTHIVCSKKFFFFEIRVFLYCASGQATDDKMARVHCIMNT